MEKKAWYPAVTALIGALIGTIVTGYLGWEKYSGSWHMKQTTDVMNCAISLYNKDTSKSKSLENYVIECNSIWKCRDDHQDEPDQLRDCLKPKTEEIETDTMSNPTN